MKYNEQKSQIKDQVSLITDHRSRINKDDSVYHEDTKTRRSLVNADNLRSSPSVSSVSGVYPVRAGMASPVVGSSVVGTANFAGTMGGGRPCPPGGRDGRPPVFFSQLRGKNPSSSFSVSSVTGVYPVRAGMASPVVAPSFVSSCLRGKSSSSVSSVTGVYPVRAGMVKSVVVPSPFVPSCAEFIPTHRDGKSSSSSPLLITHYSLFIEKAARRRAFTLIELLAVIAIMGILAAVAIPGFVALFRNSGQVQGVNQISAALGEAQTLALRLHTYVALVMYEQQPGYTGETAFAYEYAPVGQVYYNTVSFYPYLPRSVQYLPKATYTAGLVGAATNSDGGLFMPQIVEKQFGVSAAVDTPRVVVFNSSGHLVVLNSVSVVELPNATVDMSVASPYVAYTHYVGPTTPAVLVFNVGNWPQAINGTATPGYPSPGAYALGHSNTLTVNTYTGGIIQ